MQITTRPYRLDEPAFFELYVRRAALAPIEMVMAVSLTLIGLGLLGHGSPIGGMPLIFAFLIVGSRFYFKPGLSERFVKLTQGGGRTPVTRIGVFTDDGFIIRPEDAPADATKGITQMPWSKLDRVEIEGGYIFFLPFAGPRGVVVPEAAFEGDDHAELMAFIAEKGLLKAKKTPLGPESASETRPQ